MENLKNIHPPAAVQAIIADSQAIGFNMLSEPLTGSLLRMLAGSKPGGRFLELGSGSGLSTAWLLGGMDAQSSLLTVDNDKALLAILNRYLGHDPRLQAVCADGDEFVASLKGRQFDFIFADTWSGKYQMLDETLDLLAPGGLYVIDDMLPQANWPEGHDKKAADLIEHLENLTGFHCTKLAWASGLMILSKR